jgi:hypothetical protein
MDRDENTDAKEKAFSCVYAYLSWLEALGKKMDMDSRRGEKNGPQIKEK